MMAARPVCPIRSLVEDRDPRTGQRLFDIAELPPDPKLLSVRQVDDCSLAIFWFDEQRSTRFSAAWLREHCYCDQHHRSVISARVLWRGWASGICRLRYCDVMSNPNARGDWLTSLVRYGLALLSEVPCQDGEVLSVASLVGYVTETN